MSWIKKILSIFLEFGVAPLCILLAVLVGSVMLIASPVVWQATYDAPSYLPATAQKDGEIIAANLWTKTPYKEVSNSLQGRKLHQREINHYEDLQNKFRELTVLLFIFLFVLSLVLFHPRLKRMLWVSLAWLLLIALIGGVWGVYDWRNMFHTLHWWIFQNDSWKLPNRCYSLQLYPYPVWKKSMVLILGFCFGFYILLLSLAMLIEWKRKRATDAG